MKDGKRREDVINEKINIIEKLHTKNNLTKEKIESDHRPQERNEKTTCKSKN